MPELYCTLEDVADTLDLPTNTDQYGQFTFSERSHPSARQVEKMIRSNCDTIDRYLNDTWRVHRVENQIKNIPTYWHDENAIRSDYYNYGGNMVQLNRDILQWDPRQGDKLEIRNRNNSWSDITSSFMGDNASGASNGGRYGFWIDYVGGRLYITTGVFQNLSHAIRISYRYGKSGDVPWSINRLCCLMTARQVLVMQAYNIKIGSSGDIGSVRNDMIKAWQEEEAAIITANRRQSSSVVSFMR